MRRLSVFLLVTVALLFPARFVEATVIDFDGLADLTSVTTQYSGLMFSNTTALAAGFSLNEFEFPPLSGMNVVYDEGGAITIVFDSLQASVGGYVTYLTPVTFTAYGVGDTLLGNDTSDFTTNLTLSGDPGSAPNELLQLAFAAGIQKITFAGDPAGGSFTLDDLTFTPVETTPVPEPSTLLLLGSGLAGVVGWKGRKRLTRRGR